jgi:hypothetical protein
MAKQELTSGHRIWGDIEDMSANSSDSSSLISDRSGRGLRLSQEEQQRFLRERKHALEETSASKKILTLSDIGAQRATAKVGTAGVGALNRRPQDRSNPSEKSEGEPESWDVDNVMRDWRDQAAPSSAAQAPPPHGIPGMDEQGPLPSAGSAAHAVGTCRPCHYVHTKAGCEKGVNCGFCHYKHQKRRRNKASKPGEEDGEFDELPGPAGAPCYVASPSAPPAGIIDGSRPYEASEGDIVRL